MPFARVTLAVMLEIVRIAVLSDNYIWLVHEPESGETMVVDPAVADPVLSEAESRGWGITQIWNTHWHPDHTGGNQAIKAATGCLVTGPEAEKARIPTLDRMVKEGDIVSLGAIEARVLDVPAHTAGHIAYHMPSENAAFVGDTLFAMGCGRLFEGTPAMMWDSLSKLMKLPDDTKIYCGHEYTLANGKFALTLEPNNADLQSRMIEVKALRDQNKPTVPSTLAIEKRTNPFLRPDSAELRKTLGLESASDVEVFAETRRRKDSF